MEKKYASFQDFFAQNVDTRSGIEVTATYRDSVKQLSFGSFLELVEKKKTEALKSGASTIAICYENPFEVAITSLGNSLAGVRSIMIPSTSSPSEIAFMVKSTKAEFLLFDEEAYDEEEKKMMLLPLSEKTPANDLNEGTFIFFTSGSSSTPKAVELSSKALLASAYNGQCKLPCGESDRIISFLPMEHVFGFVCSFLWPLAYGAEIFFGGGLRSLKSDLDFFKPTIIPLVPVIAKYLLLSGTMPRKTDYLLIGAGPLDMASIFAIKSMGIKLAFGYGLTETASGVAIAVNKNNPLWMEPCPEDSFRIEEGGTLSIKSGSIMEGYFLNPEATRNSIDKDGYFHTSDLAKMDENGNIMILGRVDDIIALEDGEKVNALEIEEALLPSLPNIDFAINSLKGGLAIFFFSKDPCANETVSAAVAGYNKKAMILKQIVEQKRLESPLPKTKTGKIERYLLK